MEDLFMTRLVIDGKQVNYKVVFKDEEYFFIPVEENNGSPSFSFKREHDEWVSHGSIPREIQNQALVMLENYLLQQH
jgi:hypothetical protein